MPTRALTGLEQVVNRCGRAARRASVMTPGFGIAATLGVREEAQGV